MLGNLLVRWCGGLMVINPSSYTVKRHNSISINKAKIAIETVVTKKKVILLGEINTFYELTNSEINNLVKKTIKEIGYTEKKDNFYFNDVTIINLIQKQSYEISEAVEKKGAGDQGSMFGFATNETPFFLPLNFVLAKQLADELTKSRENQKIPFLKPDGKTQITLVYDKKNNPLYIETGGKEALI
ncbi:S-adenosylmethionine synthetase N-terminal domain-containing protein [Candidatus Phytoplasma oryzae]|uniref:S-adenosylmethionine synthetase N-terminal domain-containing protein n=1 Tax=Candidatus Phytoplasma oryzae TaxID=203274 RepID=UPI000DCFCC50|nr:S-adenosylmethionine synthetase N-terminal domain-containing protein [Candidatus Phytoplasma oryzae]